MKEFENDIHLRNRVILMVHRLGIKSVCETGTELGGTSNSFAAMKPIEKVITMDLEQKFSAADIFPNVEFLLGDSRLRLAEALGKVHEAKLCPVLIFLDAHSGHDTDICPLKEELKIVADFFYNRPEAPPPVIVIHDCEVPSKPFGFDKYLDGPICWDNLKDSITPIYPNGYAQYYNDEAVGAARGCLFVEPRNL